jgi:hypothetical protein
VRLGITGTYSSGKTLTAMALSYYTGQPRTRAKTMREILPDAAPGKTLEEITAAELLQMIMVRHVERVVHETALSDGFVSDGCSLQEWIYGTVRVTVGINPNDSIGLPDLEAVKKTPEVRFFEEVITSMGVAMKQHVKRSFDAFIHLRNELPLAVDGHRPVNERFRTMSDQMLLTVLDELRIPYRIVGGDLPSRLEQIARIHDLRPVRGVDEAIALAHMEYAQQDVRDELQRAADASPDATTTAPGNGTEPPVGSRVRGECRFEGTRP